MWEPHGDRYVWGEGTIGVECTDLSRVRKGAFIGNLPCEEGEWEKRVAVSSPPVLLACCVVERARMVWKSHFPSVLLKCVWYASNKQCWLSNLKSVMWGVGAKSYPVKWWWGALRTFHNKAGLERLVAFRQLREWVVQGK